MDSFKKLGLSEHILDIISQKGFESPTPIQTKIIPAILEGNKDIIGQAHTGTGKTAAFGLPIIELLSEKSRTVQALILTPTRELAIQVAEEIHSLKGRKQLSIVPIYGGQAITLQLRSLKKGVDIVVGTPGRILDHLNRRTLDLKKISFLVLDEADEMLNMGFLEDVQEIMRQTSQEKRTMLFSATMPQEIIQIAKKYMHSYDVFKVTEGQLTVSRTDQIYFEVAAGDKFESLCRIIDIEEEFYGLIFCRTKIDVDSVATHLTERGYDADALHGDMSQALREKILDKFKKRQINVLVATDVAARGIDVQDLTHVINYALPQDPQSYVHRIGRTGRAGKAGIAITFITPQEYRRFQYIKRAAKTDIRRAKLPKVQDIIETKKRRIMTAVEESIKTGLEHEYVHLSRKLLSNHAPEDIVTALLQRSFGGELSEKNYVEIESGSSSGVDKKGKTRLFVLQGKTDGLNREKLINIIQDKCKIEQNKIQDIQILDKFSFITLPFHEAEMVLAFFNNRKKGEGLFIQKAKQDRFRNSKDNFRHSTRNKNRNNAKRNSRTRTRRK
ncbi:MAG: DEAD/DEAH box helicase [Candidatus Omnitrophota bacterium]